MITPLMKQYEELKAGHPEEILLFRLGDFYEIFGEDAKLAAPILEITLTQRQGLPMCGVPHHSMGRYIGKLLKRNLRVAVAEQMEDPATAQGIVKRQVIRVISPGTVREENLLEARSHNFLSAVTIEKTSQTDVWRVGLAALDVSSGQLLAAEFEDDHHFSRLTNELALLNPAEIIFSETLPPAILPEGVPFRKINISELENFELEANALKALESHPLTLRSVGLAAAYARKMNPGEALKLKAPEWIANSESMGLDRTTLDNLEVIRNRDDGSAEHTLIQFLDRTLTAMGGRLMKLWLTRPLNSLEKIRERHDAVEFLLTHPALRQSSRESLRGVLDLERLCVRAASGRAAPRDAVGLKISLEKLGRIPQLSQVSDFSGLLNHLSQTLSDDTGEIRHGTSAELDESRNAAREGRAWLEALEARRKEETKIPSLKIGYTSVFGYYYEVTKPHASKAPAHWHRKQTLVNAERYIDEELKTLEQKILGAEEQAARIEREIFREVLERIGREVPGIQKAARAAAELDCLQAFAETADLKGLTRPQMDDGETLEITEGWHPVVKESLPPGTFVPNDCRLNSAPDQIIILTGPNMSGKSTYLRQVALTVLMAQSGSFVPAQKARIGLTDRILSRIGTGDKLASGESTFMVEMKETAKILRDATARSLLILDEVGRGTSTYDGISIAWAVIEHLNRPPKPMVLFATHYFELTHLAGELEGVKNFNVQAKEKGDSVIFLHKIAPGPADRSYGIHVAQIAGLPPSVVERAKKILSRLENEHESLLQSRKFKQQELAL